MNIITKQGNESANEIARLLDLLNDELKVFELLQSAESWQAKVALYNLKKALVYARKGTNER